MNKFPKIVSVSFVVALLPACASTQQAGYANAPMRSEVIVEDARYVALVESMAKQRGTKVMWVNAPRKRMMATAATAP
ncbi:MAG: hypothetical protein EOP92_32120 [Lysobacteraceae bacterium]|nr:MAG: hypothetical protein EOP92_32120 [Xanthomonadaceae bacterium]